MKINTVKDLVDEFFNQFVIINQGAIIHYKQGDTDGITMVKPVQKNVCRFSEAAGCCNVSVAFDMQSGDDKVLMLPYHNGDCYGIELPKEYDAAGGVPETFSKVLLTPLLNGCSIHIINAGTTWKVLHDARAEGVKEKETRRCTEINEKEFISFEFSQQGYHFTRPETPSPSKTKPDIMKVPAASVLFFYNEEAKDWYMLANCLLNDKMEYGYFKSFRELMKCQEGIGQVEPYK